MNRYLSTTLVGTLLFLGSSSTVWSKAGPVRSGTVTAELVARDASIRPGEAFWVALKLDHDTHWHSYWINAGTGYATSLTWTLPEGFTAGPIVWPAPHVIKDSAGTVTGNGYADRTFLFVKITPPATLAPGSEVTLKALADWLMCMDVCMPGDANVELTLPVKDEPPAENAAVAREFAAAFADLPGVPQDWKVSATRDGSVIKLRLTPAPGNTRQPTGLHYFDENAVVDYAEAQTAREENGAFVLELAATADAPADAPGLKGILTAENGWGSTSSYGGIHIDVPFRETPQVAAVTATTTSADAGGTGGTFLGTLFLAFLGGLVLNLMPCVFPILGIKIMGFVNQAGSERKKVAAHGLAFAAGVLVSFWALAGLLLALRAGGEQLGWGFQLQSPVFVYGMSAFLLIFALNLSGLFEVGLSATGAGANLQSKEGLTGSFFTGGLATLVATPCSAPFLAPALGAALAMSAGESVLIFTFIALGLAAPYLLLSIFPQAIKMLPRPGAWMETFKQFMAFPLYATVGWLLWVLAAQTAHDDQGLLMISFGFVLIAMAAWLYGRFGQSYGKRSRQILGRVGAAAVLACGLWLGWPSAVQSAPTTESGEAGYLVVWEKWSPEAVAAAQSAGRFVYVDFTARWCATCQTNKAVVFSSAEVLARFGERNVLLLRADWTNKDPQITAELAKWTRSAVPFNLLYAPGLAEPVVLPELLTAGTVLDALSRVTVGG